MTRATLAALLSHWRRRPFQLLTLILGLALATALWTGVQAINSEARASFARAADTLGGSRAFLALPTGPMDETRFADLRRAGWQVTPMIEGWIAAPGGRVRLVGLDPLSAPGDMMPQGGPDDGAEGEDFDLLAFISEPGRLLVAPGTAERIAGADLPRAILSEAVAPGLAITDIGTAQRLLDMDGQVSRLILLDAQPLAQADLAEVAPELDLTRGDAAGDMARLTDSFLLNLTAFGLLSFVVGLFIVHGTIGLAFEQRRPLFRTLRALGVPGRSLTALAAAELVIFAAVAGAIGVVLGYLIAAALLPDVAATLRGLYGVPVEGALGLRPQWWLAGLGIAVLGTAAAGAGSLWKTATLPVLAPARPRAWARATRRTALMQLAAAGALALFAFAAGWFGSGLVAGFAMLGALLVAAALCLPIVLTLALALAARTARGPMADWFWADTRQQLPGLSLALMALLLALATNIGVGTMVSSFRLTFTGWLDQRLASELYVRAETPEQAARLRAFLTPRSDAVLPIWNVEANVLGAPAEIFGVADHPTYRENWPLLSALPGVWDRIVRGEAVLVNEQLARREGLSPGDAIALPGGWKGAVGGVYSDYGNPLGQVMVGLSTFEARFPEAPRLNFGVRVPVAEVPELSRALTGEFGLPPENLTDQASLKSYSIGVFDRTFLVTGALNVLTLAVAGFAILTSLLTLGAMRLPQLAPAWAMGMTRQRLARLEFLRAILLAALTGLAAIPVGLLLAWVLLAVVNVEAFGWRLPLHLFPGQWAQLLILALAAAALAALWPAVRMARMAPARLLGVFVHER